MLKKRLKDPVTLRLLAFALLLMGFGFREAHIQVCFVDIAPFVFFGMLIATAQVIENQTAKPAEQ